MLRFCVSLFALMVFFCSTDYQKKLSAQTPPYFSFHSENKGYLQYYYFANIFDSSATTFTFGEVAIAHNGSRLRIFSALTLAPEQEIQASHIQGENVDLRTVARTEDFTLEGGGTLTWFGQLTSFRSPCHDGYSGGEGPDKPSQAWALLDQTEFVTELVRVSDDTRIAVLDSVGVMPPVSNGPPVDTRYGTSPQNVNKRYVIPGTLDNEQAYIRISPRRYGPTPLGMKLKRITNWVNFSAYYDSTGTTFISAAAYDSLGKVYYRSFFDYADSVKVTTGWLPDISNVGLNDSLTAILHNRYFTQHTSSTAGKTYWTEKNSRSKTGVIMEDVLGEATVIESNTRQSRIVAGTPEFLSLSPNPGKAGRITVKVRAYTAQNVAIRLISIDGQPLGTLWTGSLTKGIDEYTLDTSNLSSGAYFLSLENNAGNRFHNIKLIVQ
jgi:hypothetical protein